MRGRHDPVDHAGVIDLVAIIDATPRAHPRHQRRRQIPPIINILQARLNIFHVVFMVVLQLAQIGDQAIKGALVHLLRKLVAGSAQGQLDIARLGVRRRDRALHV